MDTLDDKNMREEMPDVRSAAHDDVFVSGTQGSADVDMLTRSWLAQSLERIRYWLKAASFSPEWLSAPWDHPVLGYIAAILIPLGATILTLLLRSIFPTFAIPGAFPLLAILGVALLWGTGPGLLSTLLGTALINYFILMPQFTWSLNTFQHVIETGLFLTIGITISLATSGTEHARAGAVTAQRETEIFRQRMYDLFMQAPVPILVLRGPDHRIELVNPPGMRSFTQPDVVGKTAREAMSEYVSHDFLQLLNHVYTTGIERSVKELRVLADQQGESTCKERYYNVIYQPIRTSSGEVDGVMVLSVDITEQVLSRKRIEELVAQLEAEKEALREAQQQATDRASEVEAILEAIVDGIFVYDAEAHVLRTNAAAQTFNPFSKQADYLARPFPDRFSSFLPRDKDGQAFELSNLPVMRVLRGETLTGSNTVDIIMRQLDGTDILVNVSGAPVRDDTGQMRGAVVVTRDVTEQRHIEQRTLEAFHALLAMAELIGREPEDTYTTEDETRKQIGQGVRDFAQRLAEITRRFLGCQRLSISIVEPETEILRPLAIVGRSPEQEQQWWAEQRESRLADSPNQSLLQRLQSNEVVLFDMAQPPWNTYPNPYGIRTMLIAPMSIGERLIGLLSLDYGGVEHVYTSEERALAIAAANLAATIIERDQLLRQQAALRLSNQQMAELITLAHDAIIVHTPESAIIAWNQGAERLYGWTEQETVGQVSHELLQTVFPHSREVTADLLALYGQWEGQLRHTSRDGRQVLVESRQVLVRDEAGEPTAILEINRDITERERMQREREEARANELALRETNQRMDEFLGIVSHELRTPLTTIKGNVQLAKLRLRGSLRHIPANNDVLRSILEEMQIMLERAERQVNVQNRLVGDLLDISRLQADKLELRLMPQDLATIVREMVEDQRSTTSTRNIHLDTAEGETVPVIADAERIGQVLSNYLTNALKYSPADRPVYVQLKKEDGLARVSVRDEGPGLTPSEQEHIWEQFYQAEGIKRQRGSSVGLGLGLYICRAIVKQHQGEVGVESTKGEGSTFWFTLPLAEEDHEG